MSVQRGTELLWQAKFGMAEFVRRCADPAYRAAAHTTKIYQGVEEIRKVGGGGNPSPPPPAPSGLASLIQNVVYCAQNPLAALGAPAHWKPVLTADPGYASFNTPDVVRQLKARFGIAGGWFVQTQVSVDHARQFVADLGLNFLIFQGETSEEYRTAIEAGAKLIVGNANSWTVDQRSTATAQIKAGVLAFAQEAYTNLGNPWPDQTSSGGVPAASLVLGVYDGSDETSGGWNPSLADYKAHTTPGAWKGISIYHAAGVRDWGSL